MRKLATVLGVTLVLAASAAWAQTRLLIGGDLTYTRSTVTLNGSSQTLLAAGTAGQRRGTIMVVNPSTNSIAYINLAGTTATSADIPLQPGTFFTVAGQVGPINAITVIGTNTNVLTLFVGN